MRELQALAEERRAEVEKERERRRTAELDVARWEGSASLPVIRAVFAVMAAVSTGLLSTALMSFGVVSHLWVSIPSAVVLLAGVGGMLFVGRSEQGPKRRGKR